MLYANIGVSIRVESRVEDVENALVSCAMSQDRDVQLQLAAKES
jgi:hypothetical protein